MNFIYSYVDLCCGFLLIMSFLETFLVNVIYFHSIYSLEHTVWTEQHLHLLHFYFTVHF